MIDTSNTATDRFMGGYNCAQAVLSAFSADFDLPIDLAYRLGAPFGGGMGRLGEVCGAVTGAFMVLGLKYGNTSATDQPAKERAYLTTADFAHRFRERQGSILCRDLLGMDISDPQALQIARETALFTTRCPIFVRVAIEVLEELLGEVPEV